MAFIYERAFSILLSAFTLFWLLQRGMVVQKADIYSFEVVLCEILTREEVDIPIGMDHVEFFKIGDRVEHEKYIDLMRRCLQHRPSKRPELGEIIETLETLER